MAVVEPKDDIALKYSGKVVQYFLESDEIQEVFAKVRASAIQQWESSKTPEDRERCWLKLQVLAEFKRQLRGMQHQGELTE
jgi:hypothetical protein